ncbi:hypothetical protein NMT62_24315, partial [Escherichia coli]|nr:hypothetical protein [Escherichia coli]
MLVALATVFARLAVFTWLTRLPALAGFSALTRLALATFLVALPAALTLVLTLGANLLTLLRLARFSRLADSAFDLGRLAVAIAVAALTVT